MYGPTPRTESVEQPKTLTERATVAAEKLRDLRTALIKINGTQNGAPSMLDDAIKVLADVAGVEANDIADAVFDIFKMSEGAPINEATMRRMMREVQRLTKASIKGPKR